MRWDGMGRDGTGRDGTGRDGTGRDGMGWDVMGWDRMGRDVCLLVLCNDYKHISALYEQKVTNKYVQLYP